MRRKPVLLVTLLFVLLAGAGVAATVGGTQTSSEMHPTVISVNDTANYLAVPDDEVRQQGTSGAGLSLGTAIASDTSEMQSEMIRIRFEQSYAQAENQSAKTAAVEHAADRVEQRKVTLEQRNSETIAAYANGSITAAQFSRERARIHAEAGNLQQTIQRVQNVVNVDDTYLLSSELEVRLANPAGELEALQGPASGHISAVTHGETEPQHVYLEASSTGYTYAYISGELYVRETYLGEERDPAATDQFTLGTELRESAATNRGAELYPWVVNNSVSSNLFGLGTSGIYRFSAGEVTAYIDGGTTNAFRESQRQQLDLMPISATVSNTNDSLELRLNQTYETGPLQASLRSNETGEPVDGMILVDGVPVGQTGVDGDLWVVEPRGSTQIEAVTDDGRNVSTTTVSNPTVQIT